MCFSSEIIVDRLSVERNYVLVKTYLVGSSTERVLPARTIATVSVPKQQQILHFNGTFVTLLRPAPPNRIVAKTNQ